MNTQLALVTHVTEFAGLPSARALAASGYTVVCHDRTFGDDQARTAFVAAQPALIATPEQDPAALVQAVLERFGALEALISNDSFPALRVALEEATLEQYRATLEALLVWPFALVQASVPHLKARRRGRIVLLTSAAPLRPYPGYALYTSARGGASTLAVALAKELAPFNIQVNAVAPNFLQSETYFPAAQWEQNPKYRALIEERVPLRRLGRPEEIGALIAFLASGQADFITGQVIPFTGGWP